MARERDYQYLGWVLASVASNRYKLSTCSIINTSILPQCLYEERKLCTLVCTICRHVFMAQATTVHSEQISTLQDLPLELVHHILNLGLA